jgi:asparagine synthase (glutamine-hydrolysing)
VCGIAGYANGLDATLLEPLVRRLEHRGPDEAGTHWDPELRVGLASTRLAIQDIEHGHQPMANEDQSLWIVFNGEIFNAPELRERLAAAGHRFATDHSDTEVLVHLYEEHGDAMVDELNGMFAFVVLDRARGRLFGARDHLGIKPLYLTQQTGGLAFASELKVLLTLPGVSRDVNRDALFHYLSLRYVPGPGSIVEGVERLPAAHAFSYALASRDLRTWRYWRPSFDGDVAERGPELAARLRDELREAVRRWTLSDVPIACSLSGGLDSSAIVGLMSEVGYEGLQTYSIGFEDEELDELELARETARCYGTDHHELVLRADELADDLLQMVWALDEPYAGGLPSWPVFRLMGGNVKVGMTGTGGDELFGNYGKFEPFERGRLAQLAARAGNPVVRTAARIAATVPGGWADERVRAGLRDLPGVRADPVRWHYVDRAYYFPDAEKRAHVLVDANGAPDTSALLGALFDEAATTDIRDAIVYADLHTQLAEEFLLMTDRFSMAHSVEARVPFLDRRLVEFAAGIPGSVRTQSRDPKGLLRNAVADLLPPELLTAPKRGFVIPYGEWLRNELRPAAERLLSRERIVAQGLFRPEIVERYVEPHLTGRADVADKVWNLFLFQLWHLLYVEEALTEAPTFSLADVAG